MGLVADVAAYLESEGLVGGATGWALMKRRVTDEPAPARVVIVTEDGGGAAEIPSGEGLGEAAVADPAVQVRVRAGPWDGDASFAKAMEIFGALHGQRAVILNGTEYLRIVAQSAEPLFLGFDERGRPDHTISFLCLRAQS